MAYGAVHPLPLVATGLGADLNYSPGTILPKGFFLFLGLLYLLALVADRLATRLGVPAALTVLVVGYFVGTNNGNFLGLDHAAVETLHVMSLALLLFYAGLKTDLRRIRGHLTFALLLSTVGVVASLFLLSFWLV
jgi:cell volume regulation protein A